MGNVDTVQGLYAAFGRGDIPAILERLHESVEWDLDVPDSGIPWLKPRRGRHEVLEFFQSLSGLDFVKFQPVAFLEGPGQVAGVIEVELVVRATGRSLRDQELHLCPSFRRMGTFAVGAAEPTSVAACSVLLKRVS
jgi:hypothetical protein